LANDFEVSEVVNEEDENEIVVVVSDGDNDTEKRKKDATNKQEECWE